MDRPKTIDEFQAQQLEWANRNFPNRKPHQPLLGIIEELGELFAAKYKDEVLDAIGDTAIYLTNYCSDLGLPLSYLTGTTTFEDFRTSYLVDKLKREITTRNIEEVPAWLFVQCGGVAHAQLKREQKIRTNQNHETDSITGLTAIMAMLAAYCETIGNTLGDVVLDTWERVKQRDWAANPETGETNNA